MWQACSDGRHITDLPALGVHLVHHLHGIEVVHAGVESDLIHDDDSCLLDLVLKLSDSGADVARCDDIRLPLDRRLDHVGVKGVRDQGDDQVVLGHSLLQPRAPFGIF